MFSMFISAQDWRFPELISNKPAQKVTGVIAGHRAEERQRHDFKDAAVSCAVEECCGTQQDKAGNEDADDGA